MSINADQYDLLRKPLHTLRVAKRNVGGKNLSYLESWDVRAHLIRIFGYANFDVEVVDNDLVFEREYTSGGSNARQMIEVAYKATVCLTIRSADGGHPLATYQEAAVGSASVGADNASRGDAHDNALKTAASDALKRCAINLGTQFGLSLYDDGRTSDVIRWTLVKPEGYEEPAPAAGTEEAAANVAASLGGTTVETTTEGATA